MKSIRTTTGRVLAVALAVGLPATISHAQTSLSVTGELSTSISLTTDYRFRGVSQTFGDPAVQAGAEFKFPNNFYVGSWASTVDKQLLVDSKGIEWDLYGGYRWLLDNGLAFDAGVIQYVYPGESSLGTLEGFVGVTWEFLTLKYHHSLSNKFFGIPAARGSTYYDLSARYPIGSGLTGFAQFGIQRIADNPGDYTHYALGVDKDWKGATWTAAVHGTDTDINAFNIAGRSRDLGGRGFVFSVEKNW